MTESRVTEEEGGGGGEEVRTQTFGLRREPVL